VRRGSRASHRGWLEVRRRARATSILNGLAWIVGGIALLLGGEAPGPGWADWAGYEEGERRRPPGTWKSRLVLHRTVGWPREWQVDLSHSYAARWRGPGAVAQGVTWIDQKELCWSPTRRWAGFGARSFCLRLDGIESAEVTPLGRHSAGVAIRTEDGVEVWLWLHGVQPPAFLSELKARLGSHTDEG